MPRIFISYRRADSQAIVGRLHEHLARAFGEDSVFMDVSDIPAGVNFKAYLAKQVTACDVLLVIIGEQWATITGADGRQRLADPDDFVRIEVESGLNRPDVRVIPVLIHQTPMPTRDQIPASLGDLHYRNAYRVRYDPDFGRDMAGLIKQIGGGRNVGRPWRWLAGIAAVLVVGAALVLAQLLAQGAGGTSDGIDDTTPTSPAAAAGPAGVSPAGGTTITIPAMTSVRAEPSDSAARLTVPAGDVAATVIGQNTDGTWLQVELEDGVTGWVSAANVRLVTTVAVGQGVGAETERWQVYFTAPDGNIERGRASYSGIDLRLADAIDRTTATLDIAAFEFYHPLLAQAVLDAHARGVTVRIVGDDEYAYEDESDISRFEEAGIPVVIDEGRSALMHHNFMILDGQEVWTGSWSFALSDTYNNNNNVLVLRATEVAALFQVEFNRMFVDRAFGPLAPASPTNTLTVGGRPVSVYFLPHDEALSALLDTLRAAQDSVRFLSFSFTQDDMGQALIDLQVRGVTVQGVLEGRLALVDYSELPALLCAGAEMRLDGNRYFLQHKVFIVDDDTVIIGSANFSSNAMESNAENVVIIQDRDLAALYAAEFDRRWAEAYAPDGVDCSSLGG